MNKNNGFIFNCGGSFTTDDIKSQVLYEYNYYNEKLLLKVNKFGIESIQYLPPSDVMLLNSNKVNSFSEWNVWVKKSGGRFCNNFVCPNAEKPQKAYVTYYPDHAEYYCEYKDFSVTTDVLVAHNEASAIMRVTITNLTDKSVDFTFVPSLLPYLNKAAMALWDKPEWYVKTGFRSENGYIDFYSRLFNPAGDVTKRRAMTYSIKSEGVEKVEINKAVFNGNGDFFHPELSPKKFSYSIGKVSDDFEHNPYVVGMPSVYGVAINKTIVGGGSLSFSQVLSMQDKGYCGDLNNDDIVNSRKYLYDSVIDNEINCIKQYYKDYFSKRTINTPDKQFNYYVNSFLPLQLYWVCGLDRGWPTGMQGTRDSANDFMAMNLYRHEKARGQLLHLYSCMRSDGWMPRQVSALGVHGEHDLRNYCDSTAALQEFLYEYICFSGDFDILKEQVTWLDNDVVSDIGSHMMKGLYYYFDKKNIGEHGLCKLYAGDWLDPINLAGLKGRGESVMVSCQVYRNLICAVKLLNFIDKREYAQDVRNFTVAANKLKENVNKFAYNKKGFYNGMFTDGGFWIFSDKDPDGKQRMYSSSNYHALSCGIADSKRTASVLKMSEMLKCSFGYKLFSPAFDKHIDGVGRVASGDMALGLWENGAVYNQGGNCYRARALASAHKASKLYETIQYILPYDQRKHDIKISLGAPYAITNCYQALECAPGLSGMKFLTGSVGMVVRIIYQDMFGIQADPDSLIIKPCLTKSFDGSVVKFTYRNKSVEIKYIYGNGQSILNGKILTPEKGRFVIKANDFEKENKFLIYYT